MKLILSHINSEEKISILYSLPNQNLPNLILEDLNKNYENIKNLKTNEENPHFDSGPYLNHLFNAKSTWYEELYEIFMLTLYFTEHENTHFFISIMEKTINKLQNLPNFTKIIHVNKPHTDTETFKILGSTIQILTECFFEANKLHSTYNLGLSEILILGDKGSGKTSIVDYLIHGKFIEQTSPTLTPRIYELIYNQTDFRVLDVCCDEHIKEVLEEHPLEKGKLPQALVYVIDTTLDEKKLEESVKRFKLWFQYLRQKYPQGGFNEIPVLILFNKTDINPDFDFKRYKALYNLDSQESVVYAGISAKSGTGVNENFSWLVEQIKVTTKY